MKSLKEILFTAIICYLGIAAHAQSDSVFTSTYEEPVQASGFKKHERFKYLKRSMIEEPSMFKIAVLPYWSGYYGGGVHVTLGYEKKISHSFSVTGEFVNYVRLFESKSKDLEINQQGRLRTGLNASVRYYYGQKREIENGVSGNNLLSNYFELKSENIVSYNYGAKKSFSSPNIILAWGVQRRIRKLGYFDIAMGVRIANEKFYNKSQVTPHIKIAIGLGFSKKHSKKRK